MLSSIAVVLLSVSGLMALALLVTFLLSLLLMWLGIALKRSLEAWPKATTKGESPNIRP
jgi:hypothetical protein